jgi:O-antigen/teichoic acid export membrane protein
MNKTIKSVYRNLIVFSLVASLASVAILHNLGPEIVWLFRGSEVSLEVMRYASIGSISISLFTANAVMMMFLNKAKIPAYLALAGGMLVIAGGALFAPQGIENLAIVYLAASTAAAAASFVFVLRLLKGNPATSLFARYS